MRMYVCVCTRMYTHIQVLGLVSFDLCGHCNVPSFLNSCKTRSWLFASLVRMGSAPCPQCPMPLHPGKPCRLKACPFWSLVLVGSFRMFHPLRWLRMLQLEHLRVPSTCDPLSSMLTPCPVTAVNHIPRVFLSTPLFPFSLRLQCPSACLCSKHAHICAHSSRCTQMLYMSTTE